MDVIHKNFKLVICLNKYEYNWIIYLLLALCFLCLIDFCEFYVYLANICLPLSTAVFLTSEWQNFLKYIFSLTFPPFHFLLHWIMCTVKPKQTKQQMNQNDPFCSDTQLAKIINIIIPFHQVQHEILYGDMVLYCTTLFCILYINIIV